MANFPVIPGTLNGSNARVLDGLKSGTIRNPLATEWYWIQRVAVSEITAQLEADTSTSINLNSVFRNNAFPENVQRTGAMHYVETDFAGTSITAVTIDLGDSGNGDEIFDGVNVFTGVTNDWGNNDGGTDRDGPTIETAYAPQLTIDTTGGNTNALTDGAIWLVIMFKPLPALGRVFPA